jgi:excisionase family DNA binding protein
MVPRTHPDATRAAALRHLDDPLLSTADTAEILGFSRTYVAMLVDNGRLPGATLSEGRHRRVPRSTVLQYQATMEAERANKSADYRAAARAGGMYTVSERDLVKMARRPDSGPLRKPAAKKTKHK